MNTHLAEDPGVQSDPALSTAPQGLNEALWWSLAMSRPDHLPQIIARLDMPPGVVVRIRHQAEDVIVR